MQEGGATDAAAEGGDAAVGGVGQALESNPDAPPNAPTGPSAAVCSPSPRLHEEKM